jgi:hypothetical protein
VRIKRIFIGAACALLAAVAWQYRHADFLQALPQARPAAVKFDNGSVRDDATLLPAPTASGPRSAALGTPRKCQGANASTVYTDGACPPGTREKPMGSGTVTVVESRGAAKAQPAPPARPALRELVERPDEQSLADKRMQRVIGQ